jgi:hypothetical protein
MYKAHFHKNHESGNKVDMRHLWSAEVNKSDDIPRSLTGVHFVSQDRVRYHAPPDTTEHVAVTLLGLLRESFGTELACKIYGHLMKEEVHRIWEHRGPRVFEEITGEKKLLVTASAPHCNRGSNSSSLADGGAPCVTSHADIVTLYEYDMHRSEADYTRTQRPQPFWEAMQNKGFTGVYFVSPDHR